MLRIKFRWPLRKAALLLLLLLPMSGLYAQFRFSAATGLYTNTLAIGISSEVFEIHLKNRRRPLAYQVRALTSPWPADRRKYMIGPSLVYYRNKTSAFHLYSPMNLTVGVTPFNVDKGLLAGIGIEKKFLNVVGSVEYNVLADVAPSNTSNLPRIEQAYSGVLLCFAWEI